MALGLLAALVGGVSLTTAPAASAAPAVVNVTVECPQPLSVTANVGDTIVFTFASSCNYQAGVNEWNIWNVNAADGTGQYGGFMSLVSTTAQNSPCQGDSACAYPSFYSTDDWGVSSGTSAGITVTTILSALNGEPQPLAITPGAAIGALNNEFASYVLNPWAVAIRWAGPRTSGVSAPVMMWQQAYARASAADSCQSGYTPSWDTWPNGGTGGFVCNRFVPEYGN